MPIKLNSFILPEKTKNEMVDAIGRSIKDNSEHGFRLCIGKDNNIRSGKLCKGRTCSMESAEFECKDNEKSIGIFHTHPHQKQLNPSIRDLAVGYLNGMNCIGSYEKIKCFKRKKEDPDALEYAEIRLAENREHLIVSEHRKWLAKEITNKEYGDEYRKYIKEIDKLVNSYFKVIDIM